MANSSFVKGTIETPVPTDKGGTGLSTLGTAGQTQVVNPGATGMEWGSSGHDGTETYTASTLGYLTGGDSSGNLASLQAITDGSFRTTVDGTAYNVDGVDFTLKDVVEDSGTMGYTGSTEVATTIWTGFRFNSGTATKISRVKIKLYRDDNSPTVRISLRSSLTGSDIESKTVDHVLTGGNYQNIQVDFDFTVPVTVSTSTNYYVIVRAVSGTCHIRSNSYGGNRSDNSGSTWNSSNQYDAEMIVYTNQVYDLDDVASVTQTALRTATSGNEIVVYDTDHFVFTSAQYGSNSEISLLTTSTGTVGTSIIGTSYLVGDTGNATATQGTGNDGKVATLNDDGTIDSRLVNLSMTSSERDVSSPTAGTVIYNSTTNKLNFYNGSAWEAVTSATV